MKPNSLFQCVLVTLQFSDGGVSPVRMMKATCAVLAMVTFLSWMAKCQDEFLHRTDPGREQERINVTFRWVKQHASSCPLFRTGVACCLPTCAQCLSVPVTGDFGFFFFLAFWLLFCVLCIWRLLLLLAFPFLCTKLGLLLVCLLLDTPFGRRSVGHYLCNLLGECLAARKTAYQYLGIYGGFMHVEPYMLASAGQPSLHGYDACMVYWAKGALRRNCRHKYC